VILFVFATPLICIFSSDPEVITLGTQVLRIVAFAEPLFGASIVAAGALRGAGDSKAPFLLSLATMWGVRITLSFALASSMGLNGVWLAMTIELVARGLVFLARMYRGKWLNTNLFI
ncbi:MAG: MATE family efflux transporter, partial [Oscillospiraceae bacterium]|nr:MATE family efflux transporter [Oscillospiraceae bacterium]